MYVTKNKVCLLHQSVSPQRPSAGEEEEEEADEGLTIPGSYAATFHQGEGGNEEKKCQYGSPQPGRRFG